MLEGGAKGEPGKYLERHSRGRGRMNKATRTLWLLPIPSTTSMPFTDFQKTSGKLLIGLEECQEVSISVDTNCLRLTTLDTNWTAPSQVVGVALRGPPCVRIKI